MTNARTDHAEETADWQIGTLVTSLTALQAWETPHDRLQRAKVLAAQAQALVTWLEAFCPIATAA